MNLSDVFSAVVHKELVAVDLPHAGSNQHELNGVAPLRDFFGTNEETRGKVSWHYFADDLAPTQGEGDFTFYDARAKSAERTGRSEWRFYYHGDFLSAGSVGDLLVLARSNSGRFFGLLFQSGSAWQRAAQELFGIREVEASFREISGPLLNARQIELLRQQILAELDLGLAIPVAPCDEELMVAQFGHDFPSTREVSAFARAQVDTTDCPADLVLTRWLEREEQLFRAMESVIIRQRLTRKFETVDEFIQYSLSVQNRRKSRMGFALQNHLAELFKRHRLAFVPQARTEAANRPDFLFPGEREYHDASFDAALLVMLGVKSTSKDRWRQVLTEADRIPEKHLCTLEAGISIKQTDEMRRQHLTLVVPASLHATYTEKQLADVLSVDDFIQFVRKKQASVP
ncbi:MAG TPA: type II restriction endonuclease [Kiritimatiellia bacterium]|nr:type II restriction endonuclease [Kiritimatiellia bacterium]HMP35198.1 type II restriction endonuclease [Kiritimatiellia bacterium]